MTTPETAWQPFREPLRATLTRTVAIAIVVALIVSQSMHAPGLLPLLALLFLWPSFGGHWVDLSFLNWLRPRLSSSRPLQVAARLLVWFAGGTALAVGMLLTLIAYLATVGGQAGASSSWAKWWIPGVAFICIELVAHAALQLRGRPSFFDGQG